VKFTLVFVWLISKYPAFKKYQLLPSGTYISNVFEVINMQWNRFVNIS